MRSNLMKGLVVLALLALAVPAFAQTTGRIDGRVTDEKGAPLPGVTVTLNSSALQGERLQVTDSAGAFRFLALPPGDYSLRAQLEGFGIIEQTGIAVSLGRTATLEVKLSAAIGEEVTVSGAAPIIDTTSTTAGANFSENLFKDLPTTRTFEGLAFKAPGVVSGGLGDNPSIGGASAAENRYVVDGLDTTDPAFGTIATEVPFEFIKEVEVKTGGYEAEYSGALGGVLNVITKSGGNELQGDIFGYWSDDSLQSEVPPTAQFGQDLGFTNYDFGAALGGKLIQDKLWYFIAANPSRNEENYSTLTGLHNTETTDVKFYAGKLTWQLNPSHQVVFSAFGDPTKLNDNGSAATRRAGSATIRSSAPTTSAPPTTAPCRRACSSSCRPDGRIRPSRSRRSPTRPSTRSANIAAVPFRPGAELPGRQQQAHRHHRRPLRHHLLQPRLCRRHLQPGQRRQPRATTTAAPSPGSPAPARSTTRSSSAPPTGRSTTPTSPTIRGRRRGRSSTATAAASTGRESRWTPAGSPASAGCSTVASRS